MKRSEHYGLAQYYGTDSFKSKAAEHDFHERFTQAFKDFQAETGRATLDDFYNGWIFEEM